MKFARYLLGCFAIAWIAAVQPTPAAPTGGSETLRVSGLKESVEILKDRISHIYATNESDLSFAQGSNVERDRLFQLELWRRQATGTVAEILGKKEHMGGGGI